MKGETDCVRTGWESRIAVSLALAVAVVLAGVACPAQAATPTAYVSVWSEGGLTTAIGANDPADIQSTDIGVGDTPMYLAANPSGTLVYVPNRYSVILPTAPSLGGVGVRAPAFGYGNVSVIDTATNTVVATINDPSFNEPYAVAVSPDGTEAWVANYASGDISIIDTSTNTVSGVIPSPCGYPATGIVFNPDQESRPEAYVVGNPDGVAVCVVSSSAPHDTVDSIYLDYGDNPGEYAVVTPDGSKVYVTGDAVSIIDTESRNHRSITPFDLSTVTYLAVSNDGAKVYAAGNDYFLEVIDSSSADYNDDDFTDSYVDFSNGSMVNAVTVIPGTDYGFVTDAEMQEAYAFDTSTDTEITSDALPVSLNGNPAAIIAVSGSVSPPPPSPPPTLTVQNGGMGAGWFGTCGMVVGHDGKGPMSAGEGAGMIALYFALLLLPVGILKLVHRRKRLPVGKAGIVALAIVASMLAASSAHAVRLIAPKAQRFHPTTDGQGALTVDTDQALCPGQFNFGLTLSGAKKPLDMGNISELKIEKVVVDELYTADLTAAYGITPDITLGLDIPFDYSRDNLNYTQFRQGNTGVRDDVTHLGDIRVNAKFRVLERARYGLAFIPFANFATGDKDFLLSEGKFGFGVKAAGHLDVAKPLALYANLGVEQIGKFVSAGSPDYYTPWIQYGVGAKYLLPWRKDHIVAEVNGETSWATPYRHSTLSPLEVLAAYRTVVAPGWTLEAGGGGGLNKGMGAPQWRAILGIAYKM